MTAVPGEFPNRVYEDQSGNIHLNGASLFDVNERDVAPLLAQSNASTVVTTAGAILQTTGSVIIAGSGVIALTLAAPVAGTNDGNTLTVLSTTPNAHTITAPSNTFNGGTSVATFGAAKSNGVELKAYNGAWYPVRLTGVTLA